MVKQILPAIAVVLFLSSCSAFKPLNFTSNKQVGTAPASHTRQAFIDDISVTPQTAGSTRSEVNPAPQSVVTSRPKEAKKTVIPAPAETHKITNALVNRTPEVESASPVQLKYAVLMNTEVETLPNKTLLNAVDEWYGVRYRTGGNEKNGVDCSGFTVAVYAAAYGLTLPRVSRDQYRMSRKISTTELQEGDLVFFNTRGSGVSHVGIYLGNNKFIHASVSRGVMVSDLFESYYIKRFVGAGRIDDKQFVSASN